MLPHLQWLTHLPIQLLPLHIIPLHTQHLLITRQPKPPQLPSSTLLSPPKNTRHLDASQLQPSLMASQPSTQPVWFQPLLPHLMSRFHTQPSSILVLNKSPPLKASSATEQFINRPKFVTAAIQPPPHSRERKGRRIPPPTDSHTKQPTNAQLTF
eukprot:Protomagalhaensia_wolfi_Nauph_80__3372@NODE_3428_length_802_cov_3363_677588_g2691_i0_p2_GENE_NODE_3428_length_802_cov_3363_677588_g2691_i0NODE_3428_length_802_cov_3363_677588_g2691_i0_p2_ORF_typecomplete_len155_score15_07CHAT/PF12770_7/0_19_NODE_3428_length_802_cov_3363_677588_g2691_i0295759